MRPRIISLASSYFKEHPGLVVSICYICLSYVGAIFSVSFYERFNIPIMDLAEISDFLTFGVREPVAIALLLGAVFLTGLLDIFQSYVEEVKKRWKQSQVQWKRKASHFISTGPQKESSMLVLLSLVIFLYGFAFVKIYGQKSADYVKEGYGIYVVHDEQNTLDPEILLGSTVNFVFLYDQKNDKARILPVESMSQLKPIKKVEKPSIGDAIKQFVANQF